MLLGVFKNTTMGKKKEPKTEMEWFNWYRENDPECNILTIKKTFKDRISSKTLIDKFSVIKSEYAKLQSLTASNIDPGEDIDLICLDAGVHGARSNSFHYLDGMLEHFGESGIRMYAKGWTSFEYCLWIENLYYIESDLRISKSKKKVVEEIDYPNIDAQRENQKILLLLTLGVVDFLKETYNIVGNDSKIAQILNTITGINQDTIRQNIRGFKQNTKNNPLNANKEWLANTMSAFKIPLSKIENKK